MKINNIFKQSLLFIALVVFPYNSQAQFWIGLLHGLNQGLETYNRQQTYIRQHNHGSEEKTRELRKKVQKESDGFVWTKLYTWNGHEYINYGAKDSEGNTLVPQKYDLICYHKSHDGWFSVHLNNKEGIYTKEGHCICEAIYDDVLYLKEGGNVYVDVKTNGKRGIIDKNGNYLIAPSSIYLESLFYSRVDKTFHYKNSSGEYVSTGIDIHGDYVPNNRLHENTSNGFPLASSRKYKIKRTFIGEEFRDFPGNEGYVIYENGTIVVNLGFSTMKYVLKHSPRQEYGGLISVEVTYNGEDGRLAIINIGKTITIEPIGFSSPIGYEVENEIDEVVCSVQNQEFGFDDQTDATGTGVSSEKSDRSFNSSSALNQGSQLPSGILRYIPEFYEISANFFFTSKAYKISAFYTILSTGDDKGSKVFGDKKPLMIIDNNKITIEWNDGSNSEKRIISAKKLLPVYAMMDGNQVDLPLYELDKERAVRAVRWKDSKKITVFEYVYNHNMNQYLHLFSYDLEE